MSQYAVQYTVQYIVQYTVQYTVQYKIIFSKNVCCFIQLQCQISFSVDVCIKQSFSQNCTVPFVFLHFTTNQLYTHEHNHRTEGTYRQFLTLWGIICVFGFEFLKFMFSVSSSGVQKHFSTPE